MSDTMQRPGKIAILGPYKSGTTALFVRVHTSLPPPVRTLHEVRAYIPDDDDARQWVVAKVILGVPSESGSAHYESFLGFDRQLYLARDPRDWLISGTLFLIQQFPGIYTDAGRLAGVLTLLREKERDPRSHSVTAILARVLEGDPGNSLARTVDWMRRHYAWLLDFEDGLRGAHLVKYEDFVDGHVNGIEQYLGIRLSGRSSVDDEFPHVARTRTHGNWRHWLLDEDVATFAPIFEAYLRRHEYALDWDLSDDPVINPAHCSHYIERVVALRPGAAVPARHG